MWQRSDRNLLNRRKTPPVMVSSVIESMPADWRSALDGAQPVPRPMGSGAEHRLAVPGQRLARTLGPPWRPSPQHRPHSPSRPRMEPRAPGLGGVDAGDHRGGGGQAQAVVFLLWGRQAHRVGAYIDSTGHLIVRTGSPPTATVDGSRADIAGLEAQGDEAAGRRDPAQQAGRSRDLPLPVLLATPLAAAPADPLARGPGRPAASRRYRRGARGGVWPRVLQW